MTAPIASFEAEDGWMGVELVAASEGKHSLTLRGLHGARAGKFEQQVDLTRAQRILLATALLEGTSHQVVPRP